MSRVVNQSSLASQFHDLADSMSNGKPLIPTAAFLLANLLDFFNKQWICNFLFTKEPINLVYLESPGLAQSALTLDLSIASTAEVEQPLSADSVDKTLFCARYLMIPCFAAESLTLGVGVLDPSKRDRAGQASPAAQFRNMRFVRDSKRRRTLAVMDSPEDDSIFMQYFSMDSSSCPYTLSISFRRSKFFSVAEEGLHQVNIRSLEASYIKYSHTSHLRPCINCGAPPASGCTCYSDGMQNPRHPFDTENFKLSFAHDFGEYHGLMSNVAKRSNQEVSHSFCGVRSLFQEAVDTAHMNRMSRWGMRTRLGNDTPRASVQPRFQRLDIRSDVQAVLYPDMDGHNFAHGQRVSGNENSSNRPDDDCDTVAQPTSHLPIPPSRDTGIDLHGLEAIPLLSLSQSPCADDGSAGKEFLPTATSVIHGNLHESPREMRTEAQPQNRLKHTIQQNGELSFQAINSPERQGLQEGMEMCLSSSGSLSPKDEHSPTSNFSQSRSIAKELQAARRRLQNRASAHRSNMKKKAFINDMKEKLRESKDRIEVLRDKEMKLRLENLRLRKEVEN
ncbi:unnamed protein product [Chondrus crispus]|uniref:BZIP domain-containing protein n=1 Tax=Chondrus crispus TaxID=2769 RepID=R7QKC1_CHOCR|nr:unnamed protein product [Chondrus crispus]CDF37926.1 unnamed protein product [Chondrus crispus]|eukprot:XP_005717797.1 unnamed protein product [Chondrus crispus]